VDVPDLEILSVVALTDELPQKGLRRGQVGTVVEALAPGVFEVEFSDDDGKTYAFAALSEDKLIRLYHQPEHHAA
jgi:Domain of unknown function (DUF4926)